MPPTPPPIQARLDKRALRACPPLLVIVPPDQLPSLFMLPHFLELTHNPAALFVRDADDDYVRRCIATRRVLPLAPGALLLPRGGSILADVAFANEQPEELASCLDAVRRLRPTPCCCLLTTYHLLLATTTYYYHLLRTTGAPLPSHGGVADPPHRRGRCGARAGTQ